MVKCWWKELEAVEGVVLGGKEHLPLPGSKQL
jgi:hypothetical protein